MPQQTAKPACTRENTGGVKWVGARWDGRGQTVWGRTCVLRRCCTPMGPSGTGCGLSFASSHLCSSTFAGFKQPECAGGSEINNTTHTNTATAHSFPHARCLHGSVHRCPDGVSAWGRWAAWCIPSISAACGCVYKERQNGPCLELVESTTPCSQEGYEGSDNTIIRGKRIRHIPGTRRRILFDGDDARGGSAGQEAGVVGPARQRFCGASGRQWCTGDASRTIRWVVLDLWFGSCNAQGVHRLYRWLAGARRKMPLNVMCSSSACRVCMAQLVPTTMQGDTESTLSKFARMALHAYVHPSIPVLHSDILSRSLIGAIHRVPLSLRGRRHRYSMATKGSTQHRWAHRRNSRRVQAVHGWILWTGTCVREREVQKFIYLCTYVCIVANGYKVCMCIMYIER